MEPGSFVFCLSRRLGWAAFCRDAPRTGAHPPPATDASDCLADGTIDAWGDESTTPDPVFDHLDNDPQGADVAPEKDGQTTTWTIGPEGGELSLPGGGTLVVPSGALAASVEIAVSQVKEPDSDAFQGVGPFHWFGPPGLKFQKPATVTLPFDLSGIDAKAQDVVIVWTEDSGGYAVLPTTPADVGNSVSAPVSHFSTGGPAVLKKAPEICCVDSVLGVFARFLSAGECAALGGEPSANGSDCSVACCKSDSDKLPVAMAGFLCSFHGFQKVADEACDLTCCVTGSGAALSASLLSQEDCADQGGEPMGPPSWCSLACCGEDGLYGWPSANRVPRVLCDLQGLEPLAEEACKPVCCVAAAKGGSLAAMVSAHACSARGGTAFSDTSMCEEVCCKLGILDPSGVAKLSRAECGAVGEEVDAEMCAQVCCVAEAGETFHAWIGTKGLCDKASGLSGPVGECSPVCCVPPFEIPDPTWVMPKALCEKSATVVGLEQCADVCCVLDVAISPASALVASAAMCEKEGGKPAGPPFLCAKTCCKLGAETGSVTVLVPSVTCDLAGGKTMDSQVCASVCCQFPSGAVSLASAKECAAAGGKDIGASSECDLVCCETGLPGQGDWTTVMRIPKSACPPGSVKPPESCAQVCCLVGNDASEVHAVMLPAHDCALKWGKSVAPSACDPICCGIYNPIFDTSIAKNLIRATCEQLGGIEAEPAACEEVCCQSTTNPQDAVVMPRTTCTKLGLGEVLGGPDQCEKTCCQLVLPVVEIPVVDQIARGVCDKFGKPLPDMDCQEVCCLLSGGSNASFLVTKARECFQGGGNIVGSSEQCQKVCCSGTAQGAGPAVVPAASCPPPQKAMPEAQCDTVCCVGGGFLDLQSRLMTRGECEGIQGATSHAVDACSLVCCGIVTPLVNLPANLLVPSAVCAKRGKPVDSSLCEKVCCKTTDGVEPVPAGLCPAKANVDPTQCTTVCCKAGSSKPKIMTRFKCEVSGGTEVKDQECFVTTSCKSDAECVFLDPCRSGTCNPSTGKCGTSNLPDGTPCGNWMEPCIEKSECRDGVCVPIPRGCDDGNPCTYDGCSKENGCIHTGKFGAPCNTGTLCSPPGVCDLDMQCRPTAAPCSAPPPCHVGPGKCDPATGVCTYAVDDSLPCWDGDPCTSGDHCEAGKCVGVPSGKCPVPCDEVSDCPLKGKWHCEGGNVVSAQCVNGFCESVLVEDCQSKGKECFSDPYTPNPFKWCFEAGELECRTDKDCPFGGANYCVEDPVVNNIEKYRCTLYGNHPSCMPVQLKSCQISFQTTCKDGHCQMDKHDCCVADPASLTRCSDDECTKLVVSMKPACGGFGAQPWGWSQECAELAGKYCTVCGGVPPPRGSCCKAEKTMGCENLDCQYAVCTLKPACCQAWTEECVALAKTAWQCPVCD